ncbi:MAG: 3-oxoacyl-ACP synthase III [Thermodesulfobacteriota bacterium]
MRYQRVCLYPPAYVAPPGVVTSAELEKRLAPLYQRLKLPEGRLELMSGIRERRFWGRGTRPSEAAALAGERALIAAGADPAEIDCLIFTSVSRDMMEPATASFVHRRLGLSQRCHIFDLSNACLGFLNGMVVLANMIELGQIRKGMVVAGETAEDLVESTISHLLQDLAVTRKSMKASFASLTIGSGAVAMVLGERSICDSGHLLVGGAVQANTNHNELCQGGQGQKAGILMATDSEELLKRGVETATLVWRDFLAELDWRAADIDCFCCHQVGRAHASLLCERLGIDPARNFESLSHWGNVGSVSAPLTMALAIEEGSVAAGERIALLGIGSGINCLMLGIEW